MKVIVAGSPKTGTKSMTSALTELGYSVHDYMEQFLIHYEEWMKIFLGEGSIDDFKRMYEDVDVVVDAPAYLYWNEIHQAFPDAKIILTMRDEEPWYKSLEKQWILFHKQWNTLSGLYMIKVLPIVRRFHKFIKYHDPELVGVPFHIGMFSTCFTTNEMVAKQKYRRRNAYVIQSAPKDKLLIFDVKQGWEPLCKFLGKKVPDKAFPRKNIDGKEVAQKPYDVAYGKQLRKELIVSLVLVLLFLVFLHIVLRACPLQVQAVTTLCVIIGLIAVL